jgi:hypothetical protein
MKISQLIFLLFGFFIITSCGRSEPKGIFYGGKWDDPNEFYFEFKENGKISICRGYLYERNCCSDGNWKMIGNSVVISGINNNNCPEMSSLNGTYSDCKDCIPSGKAFKKGDVTIWPDKK